MLLLELKLLGKPVPFSRFSAPPTKTKRPGHLTKKLLTFPINPKFQPKIEPNGGEGLFIFLFWSLPEFGGNIRTKKEDLEFGSKFLPNCCRTPKASGHGCESIPHAIFYSLNTG